MKNKVTVTRATRLKAVPFKEIPDGTLCLNSSGITINDKPEVGISLKAGGGLIRVSESYHLDYKIPSDGYVTFDSFDDMCKWVANGRKLEDLCDKVDGVELGSLPRETRVAFIFKNNPFMVLSDGTIFRLDSKATYDFPNAHDIVHPLGAGDTITIDRKSVV